MQWTIMNEITVSAVGALDELMEEQTKLEVEGEQLRVILNGERSVSFRVKTCPDLTKEKAAGEITQPPSGQDVLAENEGSNQEPDEELPDESEPLLLITDHVTEGAGRLLRRHGRCYLDAAGNSYLRYRDVLIFIQGQKSAGPQRGRPRRAFNAAGLKLIFAMLTQRELPSRTYREMAAAADISRGAVGYVLSDLEDMGYLLELGDGRRKLRRIPDLINRWATGYAERLRPKLVRGRFRFLREERTKDWKGIPLDPTRSVWGGEPAAALLTDYLRPERFSIYAQEKTEELLPIIEAVPDPEGPLEILDMFWDPRRLQRSPQKGPKKEAAASQQEPIAPPLLTYADLLASTESRNLHVAEMIYDQYLASES
jgi:hypothetical protein